MQGGTVRVLRSLAARYGAPPPSSAASTSPSAWRSTRRRPKPRWLYVANTRLWVVRFPLQARRLRGRGAAETVDRAAATGGHATRGLAFTPDGSRMLVSVGSESNVFTDAKAPPTAELRDLEREQPGSVPSGARRSGAPTCSPSIPTARTGRSTRPACATASGMTIQPATGELWCVVNERDELGDNLPFRLRHARRGRRLLRLALVLHRRQRGPAPPGRAARPRGQGHRPGRAVPGAFGAAQHRLLRRRQLPGRLQGRRLRRPMHGSWNRGARTGYKVDPRCRCKDGKPTGEYEDFMTGFVISDERRLGPPGRRRRREGRLAARHRGRQRHDLADQLPRRPPRGCPVVARRRQTMPVVATWHTRIGSLGSAGASDHAQRAVNPSASASTPADASAAEGSAQDARGRCTRRSRPRASPRRGASG